MADPQLITVSEANGHLALDLEVVATSPLTYEDERLPHLLVKMVAAEAIILDYLKLDGVPPVTSPPTWSDQDLQVVRAAVLIALKALWDDAPERTLGDYMKPSGTISLLLMRLRDPTLA